MNPVWINSFPFEHPRQQQIDAIDHILNTFIDTSEQQFQFLEMGVGCGKSAVAATISHWSAINSVTTPEMQAGAYILTTQKILQNQYEKDFSPYAKSIKSASAYTCNRLNTNCSEANKLFKITSEAKQPIDNACYDKCVYKVAKKDFINSQIGITNFAFFMNDALYAKAIQKRTLLVIDECHNLESSLCSLIDIHLNGNTIKKLLNIELPKIKTLSQLQYWLQNTAVDALVIEISKIKSSLSNASKHENINESLLVSLTSTLEQLLKLSVKIKRFLQTIDDSWVICDESTEDNVIIKIKPTDITQIAKDVLFKYSQRILMMSATICNPNVMAKTLGINKFNYYSMPSPFDPKNRPVHYMPIGKMSNAHFDTSMPILIEAIKEIILQHKNQKGIVHTGNYKISKALSQIFTGKQFIFHDDSNRDLALEKHLLSPEPTVLFSPSMTDGVDLHDDLSRFQIICKLPYPNLMDPWVKKRCEQDAQWYKWKTAAHIAQSVGRSIRHENDWAITYILDSCWDQFIKQSSSLFNKSFLDALC